MKIARFIYNNTEHYGMVDDGNVHLAEGFVFGDLRSAKKELKLKDVKLLPPVIPSKIICVGLNYADHADELEMSIPNEPVLFLKPSTAVVGPGEQIKYPKGVKRLDYEAELAIVIKEKCHNVKAADIDRVILGYTCMNDVTARDLQKKDGQWTRSKSFDTFCPIGPYVVTGINPGELAVELYLNGECKQSSNTRNFIFSVEKIISFVSNIMTLNPGDIIATGTPPGIGSMKAGDVVEVRIEDVGSLTNVVVKA